VDIGQVVTIFTHFNEKDRFGPLETSELAFQCKGFRRGARIKDRR
jgi:hypothetical protein